METGRATAGAGGREGLRTEGGMAAAPASRLVFEKHAAPGLQLGAEQLQALCAEMGLVLSAVEAKKAHIVLDVRLRARLCCTRAYASCPPPLLP